MVTRQALPKVCYLIQNIDNNEESRNTAAIFFVIRQHNNREGIILALFGSSESSVSEYVFAPIPSRYPKDIQFFPSKLNNIYMIMFVHTTTRYDIVDFIKLYIDTV